MTDELKIKIKINGELFPYNATGTGPILEIGATCNETVCVIGTTSISVEGLWKDENVIKWN